ncbi:FK506-binding protein 5-like isoform X1 [Cucurbita maxima]|uniref:FK506-binding protein 5-like isoform X1 n=1 Tax=Cucurbita maxima TaxID=3661 RepID=A0A6J1K436_CUCMA|nr:FK506-binding protein 5-like isoform X1 [Cucurbita maxima]
MDFRSLSRRDLQALCKRNKIPANTTNVAMADALSVLPLVEGIEEFLNGEGSGVPESPMKQEFVNSEILRTAQRTTTRRKTVKDESVTTRTRRAAAARCTEESENRDLNVVLTTPSLASGRRRMAAASSACKKVDFQMTVDVVEKEDSNLDQEKNDIEKTPSIVESRKRVAAASTRRRTETRNNGATERRVYSTRRSARLLEKSMESLSLGGDEKREPISSVHMSFDEMPDSIGSVKEYTSIEVESVKEDTNIEVESVKEDTNIEVESVKEDTNIEVESVKEDISIEVESVKEDTIIEVESVKEDTSIEVESVKEDTSIEVESVKEDASIEVESVEEDASIEVESVEEDASIEVESVEEDASIEVESVKEDTSIEVESVKEDASIEVESVEEDASIEVESVEEDASIEETESNKTDESKLDDDDLEESKKPDKSKLDNDLELEIDNQVKNKLESEVKVSEVEPEVDLDSLNCQAENLSTAQNDCSETEAPDNNLNVKCLPEVEEANEASNDDDAGEIFAEEIKDSDNFSLPTEVVDQTGVYNSSIVEQSSKEVEQNESICESECGSEEDAEEEAELTNISAELSPPHENVEEEIEDDDELIKYSTDLSLPHEEEQTQVDDDLSNVKESVIEVKDDDLELEEPEVMETVSVQAEKDDTVNSMDFPETVSEEELVDILSNVEESVVLVKDDDSELEEPEVLDPEDIRNVDAVEEPEIQNDIRCEEEIIPGSSNIKINGVQSLPSSFEADQMALANQFPRPTVETKSPVKDQSIQLLIDNSDTEEEDEDHKEQDKEILIQRQNVEKNDVSLRQLRKMFKQQLQLSKKKMDNNDNNNTKVVGGGGKLRTALQPLEENRMVAMNEVEKRL